MREVPGIGEVNGYECFREHRAPWVFERWG